VLSIRYEQKKFGKKSGEGFYVWHDDKPQKPPSAAPAPPDLQDRLLLPLINEAVAVLRERTRAESQRDSVRRQLEIIKSIDNDRFVWAHIMDEVSRSLPPYTWLKTIAQSAVVAAATPTPAPAPAKDGKGKPVPPPPPAPATLKFQISGNTVDIQALTRFMKLLESSPFVKNVTIAKAELVTLEGKEVQEFLLEAEYERPDASAIATVPVTLSSK
jgi:Tfp pilus assembly protein PilN